MKNKKNYFLDAAGLISIGILCLGYVLFSSIFAECHIKLFFLNFPIFVGEVILFLCLILFFSKCFSQPAFNKCYWAVIAYFVFVLIKAFWGYFEFGPLAFRNAALFYYPFFAILGYSFYRRDFFEQRKIFLLSLLIIGIFFIQKFNTYWTLTLFFLALILIKSYHQKSIKYIFLIGLLLVTPYILLIKTSRMMMVGNLAASVYIIFSFYKLLDWKKEVRRGMLVLSFFIIVLGVAKFGDINAMKSIVSFHKMMEIFNLYNEKVIKILKKGEYKRVKIGKVGLYNPDSFVWNARLESETNKVITGLQVRARGELGRQPKEKGLKEEVIKKNFSKVKTGVFKIEQNVIKKIFNSKYSVKTPLVIPAKAGIQSRTTGTDPFRNGSLTKASGNDGRESRLYQIHTSDKMPEKRRSISTEELFDKGQQRPVISIEKFNLKPDETKETIIPLQRNWEGACINAVFRMFIWRDMIVEFWKKKPVFGFDFGKPLRSRSLEIINWGETEWSRDGWIGAHNSYLDMVYRAGIVGVVFIGSVLTVLFQMIKKFIRLKSTTGILLCGIIVNWFVAANFLLIFELPYTAIPIWTIYGMTFAYYQNLKRSSKEVSYEQKK